ncbi:MAG: class I SAM-dependent methyltransferase [Gemmataceae bacterium]|nr:class I SAM-dependent methyltransferase [Gemmataceae bacterium]
MSDQNLHWSRVAASYEKEFIDPHRPDVRSPLRRVLRRLARRGLGAVADLGCGIGPLLPFLVEHFTKVWAVDFAAGMLERARAAAPPSAKLEFVQCPLTDLQPLHGRLDVAVAVNSLVLPDPRDLDRALTEVRACLRPHGRLLGILPAMDGVHYLTMLLVDRALALGQPLDAARKSAAHHNDHACYDFGFGEFRFQGLEQHFWQPSEIRHRLSRAGFRVRSLKKVHLSWKQFSCWRDLEHHPPPWDWFVLAEPS